MREYEALFIFSEKVGDDKATKLAEEIKRVIESHKAEALQMESIGKKPLSYPIKKLREGYFFLYKFSAPPEAIPRIKDDLKHKEEIVRNLFTLKRGR